MKVGDEVLVITFSGDLESSCRGKVIDISLNQSRIKVQTSTEVIKASVELKNKDSYISYFHMGGYRIVPLPTSVQFMKEIPDGVHTKD
jgi:hypothetical protein